MVEALLTREQILQADDLTTEIVEVPEWGGSVIVRGLTGLERGKFQSSLISQDGKVVEGRKKTRKPAFGIDISFAEIRLVAYCVVDKKGKRIFSDRDVKALGEKSGLALSRVGDVAQRLSGLDKSDLQELTENLTETQSE